MINLNEIYLGDSRDILKNIDDESIDMILTSPPYDNLRTYKDTLDWSFDTFKDITKELYRVLKNGCVMVWVVNDATVDGGKTLTSMKQCLYFQEIGFTINDVMIWRKTNPIPQIKQNRYLDSWEYMFICSKGKVNTFNPIKVPCKSAGLEYNSTAKQIQESKERVHKNIIINDEKVKENVWDIAVSQNKTSHPAVFPEQLALDHIKSWSNMGDIILDPFCGSGTTCKSAYMLNRKYIGIEKVKEYFDISKERLSLEKMKRKLF